MGLVKLGFHYGCLPPRLVAVAGVSTSRKPLFVTCGSLERMQLRRPRFPGVARLCRNSLGSGEAGIPFRPCSHAF